MKGIQVPSRGLLGGGPLRTAFEAVAIGKAEAPGQPEDRLREGGCVARWWSANAIASNMFCQ